MDPQIRILASTCRYPTIRRSCAPSAERFFSKPGLRTRRPPPIGRARRRCNVYSYSFWKSTQLSYFADQKKVTVEDRRFRWDHFLTGMHARGGFEQDGLLQRSWSVVVDLVCVGIVLWIATGLATCGGRTRFAPVGLGCAAGWQPVLHRVHDASVG